MRVLTASSHAACFRNGVRRVRASGPGPLAVRRPIAKSTARTAACPFLLLSASLFYLAAAQNWSAALARSLGCLVLAHLGDATDVYSAGPRAAATRGTSGAQQRPNFPRTAHHPWNAVLGSAALSLYARSQVVRQCVSAPTPARQAVDILWKNWVVLIYARPTHSQDFANYLQTLLCAQCRLQKVALVVDNQNLTLHYSGKIFYRTSQLDHQEPVGCGSIKILILNQKLNLKCGFEAVLNKCLKMAIYQRKNTQQLINNYRNFNVGSQIKIKRHVSTNLFVLKGVAMSRLGLNSCNTSLSLIGRWQQFLIKFFCIVGPLFEIYSWQKFVTVADWLT